MPYYFFYHDDNLFNRYIHQNILSNKQISSILTHAAYIFAVSQPLVNLLHLKGIKHTGLLYPIPDVYNHAYKIEKDTGAENLNFCISGMIEHIHFDIIKKTGSAVNKAQGRLIYIGDMDEASVKQLHSVVQVVPRLNTSNDYANYILLNVDVLIVFYSFDLQHEPRMLTSFPSKLLQYCHIGLPILIMAPVVSTLGKWALEHNWHSYIDNDEPNNILSAIEKFKNVPYRLRCKKQSEETAKSQFSPNRIHQQFLQQLNIGQSANYA